MAVVPSAAERWRQRLSNVAERCQTSGCYGRLSVFQDFFANQSRCTDMATHVVFIGLYQDGLRRTESQRLLLDRPGWFYDKLVANNLQHSLAEVVAVRSRATFSAELVVPVSFGNEYRGVLRSMAEPQS